MIFRFSSMRGCCAISFFLATAGCANAPSVSAGSQEPPRYVCYPGGFVFGLNGIRYELWPDPALFRSFDDVRPEALTLADPPAATAEACIVEQAECLQLDVDGRAARMIFPATPQYEQIIDLAGWKTVVTPMYVLDGVFTVRVETVDRDMQNSTIAIWESGARGVVWFEVRIPSAKDQTLREISCSRVSVTGLFAAAHFAEPTGPVDIVQ